MASFEPDKQFEDIKKRLISEYKNSLSVKTDKGNELIVHDVEVDDRKGVTDIDKQRTAILSGKSWNVPIIADLELKRKGKTVDRKKVVVGHIPKMTQRFGYIVDGNEYQVTNLLRLKSGAFHRKSQADELLGEFNLANREQFARGKSFKVHFDNKKAKYYLRFDNSDIPLLPLLKDLGVTDEAIKKSWGKEILEINKKDSKGKKLDNKKVLERFYRVVNKKGPGKEDQIEGLFAELLAKTEVSEETTKKTLGKAFKTVTGDALLRSSKRLLGMSKDIDEGDDRGSLEFLALHGAEDLIGNRFRDAAGKARGKLERNINSGRKKSVKSLIPVSSYDKGIKGFFHSSLANQGDQTNPLEMLSGHRKTTIMGDQGGIQSAFAILEESKLVNPSHLGFLDPIHTPEGEKTGVALALSIGAEKDGTDIKARFFDVAKKKLVRLTAGEALHKTVAFPDQYEKKGGKYTPKGKKVLASKDGKIVSVDAKDVDFILPSPRGMFGVSTNLIPFLQNNQGNRAMTAVRQQEQAVPLTYREAPLVQVQTDGSNTFEDIVGGFASFKSPEDGTIVSVSKDKIVIQSGRKKHIVKLYKDFPLKGHTVYNSEPVVKKGDKVKKGQLLADTNFTKKGKLALGTNLKTAYMPFKGYNFEDGLIISETASKKLSSEHIYPKSSSNEGNVLVNKRQFLAEYPAIFKRNQVENIDDEGVVKVGSRVEPGDPLILKLKKPDDSEFMRKRKKFGTSSLKYRNRALVWNKDHGGVVTDIVTNKDGETVVYVKTEEPAVQGDKLVGRHGNKGIITRVIPDNEMPYKEGKDGKKEIVDLVLNPLGVPGRINLGQILETVAAKVAEKEGKPYLVKNFEGGKDYLRDLKKEIKKAGIEDKEQLIDPDTGKGYEQKTLLGKQYIFKLKHQVEKKMSARSGGPGMAYDINHAPAGQSPHKGSTLGELGLYAMLAHGARENLHEMFSYKTNKNDELWNALREGTPLPPPKTPFAYEKFLGYLNAMRINVKKQGNSLQLLPFTEEQVQGLSGGKKGELKNAGLIVKGKDLKPEKGGLFDEKITGGVDGDKWSHFKLAEETPNPLFEDAIIKITGLKKDKYLGIVKGKDTIDGKTGGEAIGELLRGIDVKAERKKLERQIKTARGSKLDAINKKLKLLRVLDDNKMDADVYMMKSVPVLPPVFRPFTVKDNGDLSNDDMNGLYKDLAVVNKSLKLNKEAKLPSKYLQRSREDIYEGLKATMGTSGGMSLTRRGEYKGILDLLSGRTKTQMGGTARSSSKSGYFHKAILKRKQDFSARSTIIPEPRMDLDEVGLPEAMAWTLYQPFIERQLRVMGKTPRDALDEYKSKTPLAKKALEKVVEERPVLLKRDPALHQFNILAFKPRLVTGKALQVHPLVVSGYNADFDGDTMSVYLPLSKKATKEAEIMFPSNRLFNPTSGAIQHTPGHEALLGLYLASKPGKKTNKKYKSKADAIKDMRKGNIKLTDQIKIKGKDTTLGIERIEKVLPESLKQSGKLSERKLYDKKYSQKVLTAIAKKHPKEYGRIANNFKDLGNDYTTKLGYSIGLDDFKTINTELRDKLVDEANEKAEKINATKSFTKTQKYDKIIEEFMKVDDTLDLVNSATIEKHPTNISLMVKSGARGSPAQLKQIVSSPMLVKDGKDRVVPFLIPKSYSEGMDIASYWTAAHGARKGTIQKVQGVVGPGHISKQIQHSVMNQLITETDCGTRNGIELSIDDFKADAMDRFVAEDTKVGKGILKRNTVMTTKVKAALVKEGRKKIKMRSPLRCESDDGICQRCAGIKAEGTTWDVGTNIGIISGHSLGEPAVQLSMRVFHTGGLAKGKGADTMGAFKALSNALRLPGNLPNQATLSDVSGTITSVKKRPQGGVDITVGDKSHYVPQSIADINAFKVGIKVKRGDRLSLGTIKPSDLLEKTNIETVQDHMTNEVHNIMSSVAPVRRRNVEVVVKALTNIAKVNDSGNHPDYLRGDMQRISKINAYNKKHKDNPVKFTPILKGVNMAPLTASEDWVGRLGYTHIGRTLTEAVREGWKSNIHGFHPIPAVAFAKEFGFSEATKVRTDKWRGQY